MSLLHWAVQNKAPTYIVNIIISSEPEIIHRLDQNSKYPIQYAIEAGLDVTTLDLLIEAMNVETKSKRVYVCTLKTPPVLPINEAELYKDTFGILAKVMIKEVEAGVAIIQQEDRGKLLCFYASMLVLPHDITGMTNVFGPYFKFQVGGLIQWKLV